MFPTHLLTKAEEVLSACRARRLMLATAESCTGGLVAGLLTEIAGSSDVVDRGFVTYSNAAKSELLGVPQDLLAMYGSVSPETAQAMADGALARSKAHIALAVTGVAGPAGGTATKPVGLVHFGLARQGEATQLAERKFGAVGRTEVRLATVEVALDLIAEAVRARPAAPVPSTGPV